MFFRPFDVAEINRNSLVHSPLFQSMILTAADTIESARSFLSLFPALLASVFSPLQLTIAREGVRTFPVLASRIHSGRIARFARDHVTVICSPALTSDGQ
jgi:hypothetical protein